MKRKFLILILLKTLFQSLKLNLTTMTGFCVAVSNFVSKFAIISTYLTTTIWLWGPSYSVMLSFIFHRNRIRIRWIIRIVKFIFYFFCWRHKCQGCKNCKSENQNKLHDLEKRNSWKRYFDPKGFYKSWGRRSGYRFMPLPLRTFHTKSEREEA